MKPTLITLKIFLPTGIFMEKTNITNVTAETTVGSFCLLPHRLDCIAVLRAGILTFDDDSKEKRYVAINEGLLIKSQNNVLISTRKAISSKNLEQLKNAVEEDFLKIDEQELIMKQAIAKMQSNFIQGLSGLNNE